MIRSPMTTLKNRSVYGFQGCVCAQHSIAGEQETAGGALTKSVDDLRALASRNSGAAAARAG
jgi:hypothetical protein